MFRKMRYPVEIPLLLSIYSQILLDTIATNLYIYRACYVSLGYDKSQCAELGRDTKNTTEELETLVQPTVNHFKMVLNLSQTFIPLVINLFVGSWSDKYGRKPFLLISLIGLTITSVLMAVLAYFENLSPWVFIVATVPSMFTGGFSATFICINLYLADITTTKTRVFRYGVYEAAMALASLIGNLSAPYLLYATSYVVTFSFGASLLAVSVFYTIFLLPESLDVEQKAPTIKDLIKLMDITESFKITFKKREANKRKYTVIILILIILFNFIFYGDMALKPLFLRKKIQWTLKDMTYSSSFASVVYISGTIFGTTVLYKKLNELQLCMLAVSSYLLSCILKGIATNGYYIYVAYSIEGFGGLGTSMLRTILTYILPSHELGKVYMTSSALDDLFSTISSSGLYPVIYDATLLTNAGSFYFLDIGIYLGMMCMLFYLMRQTMPRNTVSEDEKLEKSKKIESDIATENKDVEKC